jgi:hypothetical protein
MPKSTPHPSITWALTAWYVSDNYLPLREPADGGLLYGITEAVILVSVFELVRDGGAGPKLTHPPL